MSTEPMNTVLNLSKSIKTPNSINYTSFKFPGGENHIKINEPIISDKVNIVSSMKSSDDIMTLLLATDAIKRCNNNTKINLVIPYFPYARQDRVMNKGEPLSVKVMANLINSMNYNKVVIYDPHSDVTPCLLDNVTVINNHKFVEAAIYDLIGEESTIDGIDKIRIVSPDAGAMKKIYSVCKYLCFIKNSGIILGSKNRDLDTGRITSTDFTGSVEGKICIIIDDIIDGGATFIELGKLLKQRGAAAVHLIVSHGIFSRGLENLKTVIDKIYVTDSVTNNDYLENSTDYVKVFNLIDCNKEMFE